MSAPALTQFQQGITILSADALNTMVQACDTFAELRGFVGTAGMQVYARGQAAPGDGFQGMFYWNANLVGTDNNYSTIVPSGSVQGCWVLDSATPAFPVASLPAVASVNQGLVAYATNGRNTGEGAGVGTGCLVSVNKNGVWAAVWSGVLVTA